MAREPQKGSVQLPLPTPEPQWPTIPPEEKPRTEQKLLIPPEDDSSGPTSQQADEETFKPDPPGQRWDQLSPQERARRIEEGRDERASLYSRSKG